MFQELLICPQYRRYPITNTLKIRSTPDHWTWAELKAMSKSA
jgi:hypothetical protein